MPPAVYLVPSHAAWTVLASLAIATLASYVAMDLSSRVRNADGRWNLLWWSIGSIAMGSGIWSMHFIGMLGFSLPIRLGFTGLLTVVSWVAAVAASSVALWVAGQADYSYKRVAAASLVMGLGICSMHYLGMAALDMAPGIVWHLPMVVLSAVVAIGTSAVALWLFSLLRRVRSQNRMTVQILSAVVMGSAVCGMHYTGMAAAYFPVGSICLSADSLGGPGLTGLVLAAAAMLLTGTLLTSLVEARLQVVARRLSSSLADSNTQLRLANDELQQRTFTDALTGLPNRALFEDRLRHALIRMSRANPSLIDERVAVMFINLDGFKPVNDSFGHTTGDQILRVAASRLLAVTREGDTVARVGGDEFLLLLEGLRDDGECTQVAGLILKTLAEPFAVLEKQVQIACSIGIVIHPAQGEQDKLVANANAAMYVAKRSGGGSYTLFESHMSVDASERLALQGDLRKAIGLHQFELYYQPKINGRTGSLSGVEALVRWNHPHRGLIGPMQFIGLAEQAGLVGCLGDWVIDEACRQIAAWRADGLHMTVAINLSLLQLRASGLTDSIKHSLQHHGVPAAQLVCEITESVAMENIEATQQTFDGLAAIGILLSIDDFGTGYSSLSHLRHLPVSQLKIDRSFVNELEYEEDARAIVLAVIQLAHALSLSVVAEGVERSGQRDVLIEMGCDELQGFFYARPMRADDMAQWSPDSTPGPILV